MTQISKEYAVALFELAHERQSEEATLSGLHLILSVLQEEPAYVQLLSSPNIPSRERCSLLEQAFAGKVEGDVLSFAQLLCEKGRIAQFSACVKEYEALFEALSAVSRARIVSAVPLSDDQKAALLKKLEALCGNRVQASYEIDRELLGGLKVYIDDKVIDGSLRHKLHEVKEVMGK